MIERKRKRHGFAVLLKYMHLLEGGHSFRSIEKGYGINKTYLRVLWARYQKHGLSGLKKKRIKFNYSLRKKIVLDVKENHLSLYAASLKYGASLHRISVWLRMYREFGLASLEMLKKRGKPPSMGRPKKNSKPLTELEKLQKENQELKTELALLKKVRALVEERNTRLHAIGQKPSKN